MKKSQFFSADYPHMEFLKCPKQNYFRQNK